MIARPLFNILPIFYRSFISISNISDSCRKWYLICLLITILMNHKLRSIKNLPFYYTYIIRQFLKSNYCFSHECSKIISEHFRVTGQNIVKCASFFYMVYIKYFRLGLILFRDGLQLNGIVINLPELQKHFQQQLTKGVEKVLEGSILAQLFNKLPHIQ